MNHATVAVWKCKQGHQTRGQTAAQKMGFETEQIAGLGVDTASLSGQRAWLPGTVACDDHRCPQRTLLVAIDGAGHADISLSVAIQAYRCKRLQHLEALSAGRIQQP